MDTSASQGATVTPELAATLDLLAQTIVQALGFGVAVVNLARPDGSQEVVAVAGPVEAQRSLHGNVDSADVWERLLATSESWGRLRFLDHTNDSVEAMEVLSWVPDIEVSEEADAWHPEDALFAPLYAGDGSMLGVLSVDLPRDGKRPGQGTRDALEAFAISAALAIEHATLRSRAEESEKRYQLLATSDPLTGLGNRSMLLDRLRHAVDRRPRMRSQLALVFVDLDGFKRINDGFSHAAGDLVLVTVAERLRSVVRLHDTVVRWGGDEFIVLLEELPDTETAVAVTRRINHAVAEPIDQEGDTLDVTASVGLAIGRFEDDVSAEELIRRADCAMYCAKRAGKNRMSVFDEALRHSAGAHDHVRDLMARALSQDRLVLHYQPILRLDDGAVVGAEALLRVRDDDDALLYPAAFLGTAEEHGLLPSVEHEVLLRACEQAAKWRVSGHDLRIAVNLCVAQLAAIEDLEAMVHRALEETGLPANRLTCELTEHAALDVAPATLAGMSRLVAAGVDFSIDDFGTGYGSMTYLRSMPVQEVKIDRSFVAAAPTERPAAAIVRSIATLARELGVRCVAEGVEEPEQHERLRRLGVDHGQGFFYGRPVPAEQMTAILGA